MFVFNTDSWGKVLAILLSGDVTIDGASALVAVLDSDYPFSEFSEAVLKG